MLVLKPFSYLQRKYHALCACFLKPPWLVTLIPHSQISIYISFQIEWNMIVVADFLWILNQIEFQLVQDRKTNCHYYNILFNLKGNGNFVYLILYLNAP